MPLYVKDEDIEEGFYVVTSSDIKQENLKRYNREISPTSGEYDCEQCGKSYKNRKSYIKHKKTHPQKDPDHKCEFCDKYFINTMSLVNHRAQHTVKLKFHDDVDRGTSNFICVKCGKRFKAQKHLKRHMATHDPIKDKYVCEMCSTVLHRKDNYYRHMDRHLGIGQHKCNLCEKSLSSAFDLHAHERIHTGERPYVCDICKKSFRMKRALLLHLRTHLNEKPYKCKFCEKDFAHHSNLARHLRTHTGEKPYQCLYCERRFTQTTHLGRHCKMMHKA